jgi:cobalamin biosynthesis Mg chelatase CobN
MSEDKKTAPKLKKISDVANPGESAPSPNSKSVIISHHTTIQDPMVTAENQSSSTESASENPAANPHAAKIIIQPLADSELLKPKPEEPTEYSPELVPVEDKASNEDNPEQQPTSLVTEEVVASPTVTPKTEAATTTAITSDAKIGTKDVQTDAQVAAAEDAEAKRQAELAVMIANKKFYLPINTSDRQRTMEFIISGVILSILLGLIWIDIALDAGLIHLGGLKALTHFFN